VQRAPREACGSSQGEFVPASKCYNRLNGEYRQIHRLCGLFLQGASLSEELGPFEFRTFLLDMNKLFEDFVSKVFDGPRDQAVADR
jgi:5-methylcytosine-specific restriction enzyme subunit McrC